MIKYRVPFFLALLWAPFCSAYENTTHRFLSASAIQLTVLSDSNLLSDLGLTASVFPTSAGTEKTIIELVQDGSDFEDSGVRSLRHFYNPLTGRGLEAGIFIEPPSPNWVLTPRNALPEQSFSYWDARHYFYDALTKPEEEERKKAFGLMFRTLGHVVHHLQDMAQPQHVRDDLHCKLDLCKGVPGLYQPSLYESLTDNIRTSLPTDPSAIGYNVASDSFRSTFNSPRSFWHTDPPGPGAYFGKGIAEFTHRNYVSAGTNFQGTADHLTTHRDFPEPKPLGITDWIEISDLLGATNTSRYCDVIYHAKTRPI